MSAQRQDRTGRSRRSSKATTLFPALLLPRWLGELTQSAVGRIGRWLGWTAGLILTLPFLLEAGIILPVTRLVSWLLTSPGGGRPTGMRRGRM